MGRLGNNGLMLSAGKLAVASWGQPRPLGALAAGDELDIVGNPWRFLADGKGMEGLGHDLRREASAGQKDLRLSRFFMMQSEWKAGPTLISDEHVHPIDKLAVKGPRW